MFKRVLFHKLEKFTVQTLAPTIRKWGQQIYRAGTEYTGDDQQHDELVKSLRCVPINDKVFPKLLTADWIAPNATVIGDVEFGSGSSLWHTAIVRGDTAKVSVGKNSIVQDRVIIKNSGKDDSEVKIGNNVFVSPN
jgi:serine acetyltransferase